MKLKIFAAFAAIFIAYPANAADSAVGVLQKTLAAYAALRSYTDHGVVIVELNGGSPVLLRERHSFTTYFRAPRQFLFDFQADPKGSNDRFVLWLNGAEVNTWWKTTGVHDVYPVGQGSTGFALATLPTKGTLGLIPPALLPGLTGVLTELKESALLPFETVGQHRCYRVSGIYAPAYANGTVTSTTAVILSVDAETFLLRKVFIDTPREAGPRVIERMTCVLEPQANPVIKAAVFNFQPPKRQD